MRCNVRQDIYHKDWNPAHLWQKFAKNSNIPHWSSLRAKIQAGSHPMRAPNSFNLSSAPSTMKFVANAVASTLADQPAEYGR